MRDLEEVLKDLEALLSNVRSSSFEAGRIYNMRHTPDGTPLDKRPKSSIVVEALEASKKSHDAKITALRERLESEISEWDGVITELGGDLL